MAVRLIERSWGTEVVLADGTIQRWEGSPLAFVEQYMRENGVQFKSEPTGQILVQPAAGGVYITKPDGTTQFWKGVSVENAVRSLISNFSIPAGNITIEHGPVGTPDEVRPGNPEGGVVYPGSPGGTEGGGVRGDGSPQPGADIPLDGGGGGGGGGGVISPGGPPVINRNLPQGSHRVQYGERWWETSEATLEEMARGEFKVGAPPSLGVNTSSVQPTSEQTSARAYVEDTLREYGLGQLGGLAWELIVAGASGTEAIQQIRKTDIYRARFAGNVMRGEKGLNVYSEREYLDYENRAREMLGRYELPKGFYDQAADIAFLIGNDISLDELASRVERAFARVAFAPQVIRNAFAQFYGAQGDVALAAWMLDPDKAEPLLLRQVGAAEVGGTAHQFGFGFGRERAEELADFGITRERALAGFGQLSQLRPLLTETYSELEDFTAEDEGVEAVFNLPGTGRDELESRRQKREAAFSGGGGSLLTRKGLVGLGKGE